MNGSGSGIGSGIVGGSGMPDAGPGKVLCGGLPRWRLRSGACVLVLLAACTGVETDSGSDSSSDVAVVAADGAWPPRLVAITIDDLPVVATNADTAVQWNVTNGILAALDRAAAPAIGFVNENKLGAGGARDARIRMLRAWLDAGHELGNHSYSHPDINTTPLDAYTADITRGEEVTTALRGSRPEYFRHPFLHAGNDSAKKGGLNAFLERSGYTVAPVTIDNGDWIFARAYDLALDARDDGLAARIADAYIPYMDTVFGFYEAQARSIVGREIPQILLLHANRINADRLDELLAMARRRGYGFVTLEEALREPAYTRGDGYIGPAGITWLHRWAITDRLDRAIFRGEPAVPAWVAAAVE